MLLSSALTHGELRGRAEEVAELVNDIFADKSALGIVETDPELSYLLVYLADYYLKSQGKISLLQILFVTLPLEQPID